MKVKCLSTIVFSSCSNGFAMPVFLSTSLVEISTNIVDSGNKELSAERGQE